MSTQNYYLHISSKTLANYFGSAVISPSRYINEKPYDVQSVVKNGLLLSSKEYSKNDNCSLLINLTEREERQLQRINGAYSYLGNWLPISRVGKILFKTENQMRLSVFDINAGTAFIPASLLEYAVVDESEYAEAVTGVKELDVEINHIKSIGYFNKLLGAICFSKIAKSDLRDKHVNCSPSFLSLCSFYSDIIKTEYLKQGGELDERYNLLLAQDDKHTILLEYFYSDLNKEVVEDAFAHYGISEVPNKFGSIDINALDTRSTVYSMGVVSAYGKSGSKNDRDLVADIYQEKISAKTEGVCFMYGLHYGYAKLRNKYKTSYGETNVKLELETKFDFVLLEAIYNFSIGKKGDTTNFQFDSISTKGHKAEGFEESYNYKLYNILGSNWIPQKINSDGFSQD